MERPALHDLLCEILPGPFPEEEDGHCYFQPPSNTQLFYPCIVYNYTNDLDDFADNVHYCHSKCYTVTIIDEDPDTKIPERLVNTFPYCTSDRNFDSEDLHHSVYTLYYSGPRIKEEKENEFNQMG